MFLNEREEIIMKENAISKINLIGKVGQIIANIFIGFLGFAALLMLIGTIVIAFLPKDLITFSVNGHATMDINLSSIGQVLDTAAIEEATDVFTKESNNMELNMNGSVYTMDEFSITEDAISFGGYANGITFTSGNLFTVFLTVLASLTFSIVTLCFISSLCKAFKNCVSPFDENVIKKLQYFAFSLVPWVIMSSITNSVASGMFSGNYSINFGIDLKMVFVILVILALTFIFKYGAILQQESDETL